MMSSSRFCLGYDLRRNFPMKFDIKDNNILRIYNSYLYSYKSLLLQPRWLDIILEVEQRNRYVVDKYNYDI